MAEGQELHDYVHATRNCTQVLQAMQRRVDRAFEAMDAGDMEKGRQLLEPVREGIPQAIRIISLHQDDNHDGSDA